MRMRRGESLLQSLIVIGILIGAAYLIFPSWFAGLPIGQNSALQGQITVNYEDGTSKVYMGSVLPQAVSQAGSTAPISSIVYAVKATPSWSTSATVSAVSWVGSGLVQVDGSNKQTIALSAGLPTTVTNGQVVTVSSTTISGSTLNSWIPFDQANHAVHFSMDVVMTFTPSSGEGVKMISGNAVADLSLKNIGFPALLTVQVTSTVA